MADEGITRVIRVQIDASQAYGATDKMAKNVEQMNSSIKKMQQSFGAITQAWAAFKGATAGWQGIKGIIEAADSLKQLTATFDVLMPAAAGGADMMSKLTGISLELGTTLDDTAKIAQRFAVSLGSVGATNEQVAQLTENVLMLGRIGGASMADATEGARQLGQAFASGKLQGDELRSIMERIPLVGQEIAKTMGVATGQLYKLGAEGKVTTDILFKSLLANTEKIREQFEKLPFTFEQSVNRMNTQWTLFLAAFDKASGFGQTMTTIFTYIGSLLAYITGQMKESGDQLNGWQIAAQAVGNAFRGIVIFVSAIVTGLTQAVTVTTGLVTGLIKATTGDLTGAWEDVTSGMKSAMAQGSQWKTFANDIALGTTTIGKTTKETNDYMKDYEKTLAALQKGLDGTAKKGKEALSALEKFKKTVKEMFAEFNIGPEKLKILQAAMDQVNTSTAAGVKLFEAFRDMAENIKPPTATVIAFREIDKTIDDLRDSQDVLFALQEKMMELNEVGAEGTDEWIAYGEAYQELLEKLDKTGKFKAVKEIQDAIKEVGNLQSQFDAINAAVERGDIPEAWAQNWKDKAVGVSAELKKVKTDVEEIAEAFGKMSEKFTSDFADKLIDNIGAVDKAWSDFATDFLKSIAKIITNAIFQKFLKTIVSMGAQSGGAWGSFFQAIGSAKGNAWAGSGVQYLAQGGIINSPTMFSNMGRLAVAGEAGPEAVVPLQRTSAGDLGVAASPVNIVINNTMSDEAKVSVASTDNADGSKQISIFVEQKVRSMFSSGQMDRTMTSNYGLTRQPR